MPRRARSAPVAPGGAQGEDQGGGHRHGQDPPGPAGFGRGGFLPGGRRQAGRHGLLLVWGKDRWSIEVR